MLQKENKTVILQAFRFQVFLQQLTKLTCKCKAAATTATKISKQTNKQNNHTHSHYRCRPRCVDTKLCKNSSIVAHEVCVYQSKSFFRKKTRSEQQRKLNKSKNTFEKDVNKAKVTKQTTNKRINTKQPNKRKDNKARQHQSCKYRNFVHPDNSNSSIFVDFCERVIKCKEKTIETLIKSRAVPSKNVPHFMKQNKKSHVQSVSVARNACDELLKKKNTK